MSIETVIYGLDKITIKRYVYNSVQNILRNASLSETLLEMQLTVSMSDIIWYIHKIEIFLTI